MAAFVPLFGYTPDPKGADAFVASLPHPTLAEAGPDLKAVKHDVALSRVLLKCSPNWKRGSQPIGSCTGWGGGLACGRALRLRRARRGWSAGGGVRPSVG